MKNIFLIVFCLLVSTVWAKEEKNKRIQYCTTLEEAMQQAARKHKPIFFNCYARSVSVTPSLKKCVISAIAISLRWDALRISSCS